MGMLVKLDASQWRVAHLCLGIWLEEDGFDGFHFFCWKGRDVALLQKSAED
jgi:hypothetical protein